MALATLTLSCFMFYVTSKYFPKQGIRVIDDYKKQALLIASAFSFVSLALFTSTYDFATAFVVWLIAWITLFSAIILSIKMNFKWVWVWGSMCIIFILIDLV